MNKIKQAGDTVTFDDVLELTSTYITKKEDIALIKKAYQYMNDKHNGQLRKSGEPYSIHPLWVAYILASLQTGPMTIAAGFLHDVLEDCKDVTREMMVENFGEEITSLVEGVTKIGNLKIEDETDLYAENHRKIYIAMAKDIRVILIKFADRLHNMRTLQYMSPEKQQIISKETMEVYAPIAHRLGINDIRVELEDLSLYYLDRPAYEEINALLDKNTMDRKEAVDKMMNQIRELLDKNGIKYHLKGRVKHIYSIYKKMIKKGKSFDELYDLNALRIITDGDDKMTCYEVLGIIHENYRPLPGRFKDYIAMPKPNNYQSLHTVIVGEKGTIFEIQIRNEAMDEIAERGIAAHWRYKEGTQYSSKNEQKEIVEKLQWLREFISLSDDIKDADAQEYYNSLRKDIFEANVYVFTPQGKVIELPNGSTPIDFAYRIHTEVGNHCVGASVNHKMVPLTHTLQTGDMCEIKTSKTSPGPSEDWLKIVHTTRARNKIKAFFNEKESETRKITIEVGRKMLRDEIRKRNLDEKEYMAPEPYKPILGAFGVESFDDLLYHMGKKTVTAYAVMDKARPRKQGFFDGLQKIIAKNPTPEYKINNSSSTGVVVSGIASVKTIISNCCSPIPGDDIVGFISRGQGVKIHRKDCPNISTDDMKKRLVPVYWDNASITARKYDVDVEIDCADRRNLLNDIISTLAAHKINIVSIHSDTVDTQAIMTICMQVDDAEHLRSTVANIQKIQGVYEVKRLIK